MPPIDDQLPDPDPDQPLIHPPGGYATCASPEATAEFFEKLIAEFASHGIVASAAPTNLFYNEFLRLLPPPRPRIIVAKVLTVVYDTAALYAPGGSLTRRHVEQVMRLPGITRVIVEDTLSNFDAKFHVVGQDNDLKHCALFYRPTLLTYLVDTDVHASKLLRQWSRARLDT